MDEPPLPPFMHETASEKARLAEDAWNSRDPSRVVLANTPDSRWRNRSEFLQGRDDSGQWYRSYGNENWEFEAHGLMRTRIASINDAPIRDSERKYHWPLGRCPDDHASLSALGLLSLTQIGDRVAQAPPRVIAR